MTSDRLAFSHEMNNLLGKILGAAELALLNDPPAAVRAELEIIVTLAEEGGALLRRLAAERRS